MSVKQYAFWTGAHIDRVILDHELKREYQTWLHERDRDRDHYDGHPDRTAEEIHEWADGIPTPDELVKGRRRWLMLLVFRKSGGS